MVAHVLRLKLRLLAGTFRRRPAQVFGLVIGLLYVLLLTVAVLTTFSVLRSTTAEIAHVSATVLGGGIVLGFLLLPFAFGVDDPLDPRRFALFGIPANGLTVALTVAAFVALPALLVAIVAIAQVVTWSGRGAGPMLWSVLAALLVVPTCVIGARVASGVAALAVSSRRARDIASIGVVIVLALAVPALLIGAAVDTERYVLPLVRTVAAVAQWTPFGAAWSMPGSIALDHPGQALAQLGIAAGFLLVLVAAWRLIVHLLLTRPQRERVAKVYVGLGVIGRLPATPGWAVAARSISYWIRDGRYGVPLAILPFLPLFVCAVLAIAGVPGAIIAWLPVPMLCLFIGWSVHNDTALDNTAFWLHVASGIHGRADRLGRLAPPLIIGLIVALGGSIATVAFTQDWSALPGLLGLSIGVLLIGLGVSSLFSARFPYPAVRPGDTAFAQPQSAGQTGSVVQSVSFLGTIALSLPIVAMIWLGARVNVGYHWLALAIGLVLGFIVLGVGVGVGGRWVERRGPEVLAEAVRN